MMFANKGNGIAKLERGKIGTGVPVCFRKAVPKYCPAAYGKKLRSMAEQNAMVYEKKGE